jgi:hypothetical protein
LVSLGARKTIAKPSIASPAMALERINRRRDIGIHVREVQHVVHLVESNEAAHEIAEFHEFDAIVGITPVDDGHLNFDE